MHRRIVVWTAAAMMLGLTACTINVPASAPERNTQETQQSPESAPAAPAVDPSIEACLEISNKLTIAAAKIVELSATTDANDMQTAVDSYAELAAALGSIADTASNQDLRNAALAAQADFAAISAGLKRVYIDDDITGLSELTEATLSMQTTYPALLATCGPAS